MRTMELLSPAGDMAALRAAVDCGANAVYLGYKAFGARASAVNFDAGALAQAVEYAHLYHVRVHVTVNTLVKEREIPDVLDALTQIQAAGAAVHGQVVLLVLHLVVPQDAEEKARG